MSTLDIYDRDRLDIAQVYPAADTPALQDERDEQSPPLLGIVFAVALSVPLWMIIGATIWWFR